eukprot:9296816-Pyramimonas_sp.AAC.1
MLDIYDQAQALEDGSRSKKSRPRKRSIDSLASRAASQSGGPRRPARAFPAQQGHVEDGRASADAHIEHSAARA